MKLGFYSNFMRNIECKETQFTKFLESKWTNKAYLPVIRKILISHWLRFPTSQLTRSNDHNSRQPR